MQIFFHDGERRLRAESGYGQLAAGLAAELPLLGHRLDFAFDPAADVCLHICPPSSIRPERLPLRQAAFTMHELEHLPEAKQGWVGVLNSVDLVLTPTAWNRDVWRRLGVRTPIEVVPLGIDPHVYRPARTKHFTVLTVHENLGSDSSRENWRDTLRAYYAAFGGRSDVELIIKTWRWKPGDWEAAKDEAAAELDLAGEAVPAISVVDDELGADEMRDLYQRCWLFLKNANREGWGLPASEAAACGAPLAASRIEPLLSHLPEDTQWFEPGDRDALAGILVSACEAQQRAMQRAHRHTWRGTAELTGRALVRHFG